LYICLFSSLHPHRQMDNVGGGGSEFCRFMYV